MNPQAQNALLKTLEEPQAENVFLLLCEDTVAAATDDRFTVPEHKAASVVGEMVLKGIGNERVPRPSIGRRRCILPAGASVWRWNCDG